MMCLRSAVLALAACFAANPALADAGVTPDTITFAQIASTSGPTAGIGAELRAGAVAAFEEANRAGGVHGRRLVLETHDDGYDPARSIGVIKTVIRDKSALAFLASVGTGTTKVAQPIAARAGLAYVAPYTGAAFLRDPALGNVFNVRGTYESEIEGSVRYLVDELGLKRIALLYQDDAFGEIGLKALTESLAARDLEPHATGSCMPNTTAVKTALIDIRRTRPDAVLMVATNPQVVNFVEVGRSIDFAPPLVALSIVGSEALAEALGAAGTGIVVSQVVPSPEDTAKPVVTAYREAMAASAPDAKPGFVSLEGYVAGRLAIAALEAAGPDVTPESYVTALSGVSQLDLGGVTLEYGPEDNQGLDSVFMTRLSESGVFVPVDGG